MQFCVICEGSALGQIIKREDEHFFKTELDNIYCISNSLVTQRKLYKVLCTEHKIKYEICVFLLGAKYSQKIS